MHTRRVTRYITDCGRGFWSRTQAETHEQNCKCWSNPKNRTCKTCKFGEKETAEPDVGIMGGYWQCWSETLVRDDHQGAPEGHDYISVNCIGYEQRAGA